MYALLKIWVKIALRFYCRSISFSVKPHDNLPTILACNHPNSFLDALIIGSHYNRPIYFLARGDAFSKPWVNYILRIMHLIPIYRITEGRNQLKNNEATFKECLSLLESNGVLLVFPEGICRNEWSVQPLKKGTARLAFMAWHEAQLTKMVIRPVSISYSSFTRVPMDVWIKEGEAIYCFAEKNDPVKFYQQFNNKLHEQLEANLADKERMSKTKPFNYRKLLLAIPAFAGWITHKWLYVLLNALACRKTKNTVFLQSVLFALLLLIYPVFLVVTTCIVIFFTGNLLFALLLAVLPLLAFSYKKYLE